MEASWKRDGGEFSRLRVVGPPMSLDFMALPITDVLHLDPISMMDSTGAHFQVSTDGDWGEGLLRKYGALPPIWVRGAASNGDAEQRLLNIEVLAWLAACTGVQPGSWGQLRYREPPEPTTLRLLGGLLLRFALSMAIRAMDKSRHCSCPISGSANRHSLFSSFPHHNTTDIYLIQAS